MKIAPPCGEQPSLATRLLPAHEFLRSKPGRASHDEGQQRTGQESGSPVLAMDDGPGFFGPIVVEAPTGDEAMRLFDGLALLSSVPLFVELKRAREEWKTS